MQQPMQTTSSNPDISGQLAALTPAQRALLELRLMRKNSNHTAPRQVIPRQADRKVAPLSYNQQGLWLLNELMEGAPIYHTPTAARLTGTLDVAALQKALKTIFARHDALRTIFKIDDGTPVQLVSDVPLDVPLIDLTERSESDREVEAQRILGDVASRPFDLTQGPLIRAVIVRMQEQEHFLLVNMHHIVTDGWSIGVLHRELSALYQAFVKGRPSPLPELPIQYPDYAIWQRQELDEGAGEKQLAYWKKQFATLPPVLELPTDRPRPAVQAYRAFPAAQHTLCLSKQLTQDLKRLCQKENVTLFMALLAAYQILLHRYTGEEDIVVGTAIAGRQFSELENLIGVFINTLALRVDLSGDVTCRDLLARVKQVSLGAFEYQDLPFEQLVKELRPERTLAQGPLFQVMFLLQSEEILPLEMPGVTVEHFQAQHLMADYDLTLDVVERDEQIVCNFKSNADLFESETITRMMSHFQTLLEGIVANPTEKIFELPLVGEAERHKLLIDWNQTAREFPANQCAHQLFEQQAARTPNAAAVIFADQQLTYAELNARANRLAHYLRGLGVGPDTLVGISVERSLELAIGLLGILKAGAAYVPLDPTFPKDRVAFMLEDTKVPVLVTSRTLAANLPAHRAQIVRLDSDAKAIARESTENPEATATPDNLVYVIYTSGSTGRPKGVRSNHRGLTNILCSLQREPGMTASDTVLSVTTLSFDIFSQDLLLPLISGARLVIVSSEVAADGNLLRAALERTQATVMQATPTSWRMLLEAGWRGHDRLRIFCGAEALTRDLADQLLERSAEIWNIYGPTESSIWTTVGKVERGAGPISIGRPVANTQVYLLDRDLKPVPIGVPGELHVGSIGIARGYLNRPELTTEKFVPNPFSNDPNSRLYKTGDLARYRADGRLDCLGRMDDQVKIRGFRIELGEIESILRLHPVVRQCVVVAREDTPGDRRLVAYVVPAEAGSVDANRLRAFLQEQLPDYMLPSAIVELKELPLTPTMKVNRRALPPPVYDAQANEGYVAPQSPVEEKLAALWAEVIKVERVGMNDNFFELGGHSLLAVRLFAKIADSFGKRLPLATLFQAPTIAQLAKLLSEEEWSAPWSSLVAIERNGSKRPFFCVHAAGGNVVELHELARHLGQDRPFYAFQSRGLDGRQEPLSDIREMAAHYISEMRLVQPHGPYLLGGRSFGGTVAFEMACQLQDAGEEVGLLAVLDTYPVGHFKLQPGISTRAYRRQRFFRKMKGHVNNLSRLSIREKGKYLQTKLHFAPDKTKHQLWKSLVRLFEKLDRPLPAKLRIIQQLNFLASSNYTPRVYRGRVSLFSATGDLNAVNDLQEGWRSLALLGVDVHEIPGNHINLIKEPHVGALAKKLRSCLDHAQQNQSTVSQAA
jgi:amino acid adenylation domain-containing protein